MTLHLQVEHTPALHEYGSSAPMALPASSTLTVLRGRSKANARPSLITVIWLTAESTWRAASRAWRLFSLPAAANSSKWMRSLGMPLALRLSRTVSVISCGPQIKAASRAFTSTQRLNSCSHLPASMRPL
ncbi:hypothetical protein D3C84_1020650 [compost metagenome]